MKFHSTLKSEKRFAVTLFLLIPVLLFVVFYVYPIGYTVYLSFHEWDGISPNLKPAGLKNYALILERTELHTAVINNFQWLIFYIIVPPALGLGLALILNRGIRGESIFETIFFVPNTITPVAVATIWRWLYNPGFGIINKFLEIIGLQALQQNWLGDPHLATYSSMIAATWFVVGASFIIYLAGLKGIPQDLIDAAKIDGASFFKALYYVIWPMLTPATIIVIALQAMRAIKLFDLLFALTGGGPAYFTTVLGVLMYDVAFRRFHMGQGATVAIILFILAAIIISPYMIYTSRKLEEIQQ
jgi:raffinose/stachyose/melibiose transport system permease protein